MGGNTPFKQITRYSKDSNTKGNLTTARSTNSATFKQSDTNTGPYHAPYWPTHAPKISSNASNGTGYVPGNWACQLPDINELVDEVRH